MAAPENTGETGGATESLTLPPVRDALLLLVALAGVSASGPVMAATVAPALAIAFWRNALGAGLTGVLAAVRNRAELVGLTGRELRTAAFAGLLLAAHFATWVPSVKYTAVASATALVGLQSVFTALLARVAGRRLARPVWWGMALAVVGTGLVAGADLGVSTRSLVGDLLAVAGGFFAAAYVTAGAAARRSMSTTAYTTVCYTVCAAVLLVVCLVGRQSLGGYPARSWVLIALVTLSAQLLGHTLLNLVLRSMSATALSLAILLETPGAASIALIWLHQSPPASALPGLVLLFAGLVVVVRAPSVAADLSPGPDAGQSPVVATPADID